MKGEDEGEMVKSKRGKVVQRHKRTDDGDRAEKAGRESSHIAKSNGYMGGTFDLGRPLFSEVREKAGLLQVLFLYFHSMSYLSV